MLRIRGARAKHLIRLNRFIDFYAHAHSSHIYIRLRVVDIAAASSTASNDNLCEDGDAAPSQFAAPVSRDAGDPFQVGVLSPTHENHDSGDCEVFHLDIDLEENVAAFSLG